MKELVRNIKFCKRTNKFQETISRDKSNIIKDSRIIIKGDKTTNCYGVSYEFSENLLDNNVRKDYKKSDNKTVQ